MSNYIPPDKTATRLQRQTLAMEVAGLHLCLQCGVISRRIFNMISAINNHDLGERRPVLAVRRVHKEILERCDPLADQVPSTCHAHLQC